MSTDTKPADVVNFLEYVKKKYYGSEFRELTSKRQNHLQVVVYFNFDYQKKVK